MHLAWDLKLLAYVRRETGDANPPVHLAAALAGRRLVVAGTLPEFLQGHRDIHALAITKNRELYFCSWLLLTDEDLQFARVINLVTVQFSDHVADLEPRLSARRTGLDLRHHSALGFRISEEFSILRGHVRDADADVAMAHLSVTDQSFHGGSHDLTGNGKSHTGERAGG